MEAQTIKKIKKTREKDFSYRLNETGEYRDTWRIFRIMAEFVEGYQFLSKFENGVTVLGSARIGEDRPEYRIARELGALLASHGYTTITGGGPGIMEAANRGAYEGGGESVGLNIQLPFEQRTNSYVKKSAAFYYFFTRKVMLTSPAHAFVFFPGGFGTLDEFFEVVNHIEIGKMCHVPIVLVGKNYWEPLLDFIKNGCCRFDQSKFEAIDAWRLVDTAEEAFQAIEAAEKGSRSCDLSAMNFHSGQKNVDWRIFRIMAELVEGFEFLTGLVEDITVLGTHHMESDTPYYRTAYALGRELGSRGYTIVTGGGTGINEAVNKGAFEAGGHSYAIGMEAYGEPPINHYVTKSIMFTFPFTRKVIVTAPSKAFVFFPGGFGTLHHLFEVLTLVQTGKMQSIPILLYDTAFWKPLDAFIRQTLQVQFGAISPDDVSIYRMVDDTKEIVEAVETFRNGKKD